MDGEECVELGWFTPAAALEAHRDGQILLVFPTIKHLEQLAAFPPPRSCWTTRAVARCGRSSRASSSRARSPACAAGRARLRRAVAQRCARTRACPPRHALRNRPRLTVAVTGPTGEIGQAVVGALERSHEVRHDPRDGAAAVRPGRAWLEEGHLSAGRRPRPPRRGRAGGGCGRRRAPRVPDHGRRRGRPRGEPGGLAQRLRGGRRGGRQAARLCLVGRRIRIPRRQPPAADRGDARARHRGPLLLGPEGRGRGAAGGDAERQLRPTPTCYDRASSPARTRRC